MDEDENEDGDGTYRRGFPETALLRYLARGVVMAPAGFWFWIVLDYFIFPFVDLNRALHRRPLQGVILCAKYLTRQSKFRYICTLAPI
jgi:hypothetical protein